MNELISLHQVEMAGEAVETVNARELHAFLQVGKRFASWITERIEEYGFVENVDYVIMKEVFPETGKNPQGGRPRKEYFITLDMAKELAMVERNERGRQARKYFIECERRLKQIRARPPEEYAYRMLNDPAALRQLLGDYAEKVIKLEQKIEQDRPKVTFYDKFVNTEGLYGLQNAARAIGAKPNKFIQWLKQKYLFYQGNALVAYSPYVKMGIFEVRSTMVDEKARMRTFVTPKGLKYLAERVPEHILIEPRQSRLPLQSDSDDFWSSSAA